MVAPKRAVCFNDAKVASLAVAVLGHGLGSFTDSVFGQFTGQKQSDSGLDLTGTDGRLLGVFRQTRSFARNTFEDVVDERVHDAHGFAGDTGVGMNLLQHSVNEDSITSLHPSLLFLFTTVSSRFFLGSLLLLFSFFPSFFGCHRSTGFDKIILFGNFQTPTRYFKETLVSIEVLLVYR